MHIQVVIVLLMFDVGRSFEDEIWHADKYRAVRSPPPRGYSMGNVQLRALIPKEYNILETPPTFNNSAIQVEFNVLVMGIWIVEESQELISVDLKMQIYWKDERLSHLTDPNPNRTRNFCILKPQLLDYIWQPDIYIEKVKSIDHIALLSKPASLRIYPDSVLRYSARITVTVSCQMDFRYYPFDTQRCNIDLQNYSFQIDRMKLGWKGNVAKLLPTIVLANFNVDLDAVQDYNVTSLSGDVYSGIRFTIILRRKLSYHLLQTYLLSSIFILVSWLSFILPYESTTERMGYCMTCLFTLTSMFSAVRQSTPNVSYIKALDIWMVTCVIFIFLTLTQHAILSRIKRSAKFEKYILEKNFLKSNDSLQKEINDTTNRNIEETSFTGNAPLNARKENGVENDITKSELEKSTDYKKIIRKADRYLSLILPFLFMNFNIIYWSWLITIKYSQ